MIVVDTSALMAIVLEQENAKACSSSIASADKLVISAGTMAEALIVAGRKNVADETFGLIDGLAFEVDAVTAAVSRRVAQVYARWGKGVHPAALNFGDCFAYELARRNACPLLFVGNDFTKTDIASAL